MDRLVSSSRKKPRKSLLPTYLNSGGDLGNSGKLLLEQVSDVMSNEIDTVGMIIT